MSRSTLLLAALLFALCAAPVRAQCAGDLNNDGVVTIDEILTMVRAALNGCPLPGAFPSCPGDLNGDGIVAIDEILHALNMALSGCRPPTATPLPSTATPTPSATEPTTPTPTATATASPTAPLPTCPYTFLDNTLGGNASCDYFGPFNSDPSCPTDLEALFTGDGEIVGVGIGTEDMITFVATVTSATSASLVGYTIGSDTRLLDVSGTVELQQEGRVLVIAPDSPPFDIAGDNGQCAFVQYTGTYEGVLSGMAAPAMRPARRAASLEPVSLRLR
jgi:hypothetical protein